MGRKHFDGSKLASRPAQKRIRHGDLHSGKGLPCSLPRAEKREENGFLLPLRMNETVEVCLTERETYTHTHGQTRY